MTRGVSGVKPHIALLTTTLDLSGAERVLALVADGLAEAGYRVTVLALQRRSGMLATALRRRDIEVHDLRMAGSLDVPIVWRLRNWLLQERVDVLYTFLFHAHLVGRSAGRLAAVPVLMSSQQYTNWGGRWRRGLEQWTARWCDAIVAVSESARQDLVTNMLVPADRVHLIPNAIDLAAFEPTREPFSGSDEAITVGSASRLVEERDHESLVRGFARAVATAPTLRLRLAGAGPLEGRIRAVTSELGLAGHVEMLGQVGNVRAFYQELDIYVQPSRTEGLPCSVLEAMAMARPVIATDVPGNRDAVVHGESGVLVTPASPSAWADALLALIGDRPHALRLGRAARQRAHATFGAGAMVASTRHLLDQLGVPIGSERT